MEYMTTKEASLKWGISDRRIRTLCRDGKVSGALLEGKSYKIPVDAQKPLDGRVKRTDAYKFLKWHDEVIGVIDENFVVQFIKPEYNEVVSLYTNGKTSWSREEFTSFLGERIVNRERRDIEKILFRCGLSRYDILKLGIITRGIHSKDLLWIADSEGDTFSKAITNVFESIFIRKKDLQGNSLDSPEGYNVKRYGAYNGKYGIYKKRISPLTTDVESEIAAYKLACRMGIECCPAYRTDDDTMFSEFAYDFASEYIVHFRHLFDGARSENEYLNLVNARPQYRDDIIKMLIFDFVTRQDDRHLSNIAVKLNRDGETFYPLYDNGRSLFYEDTEDFVRKACEDTALYSTNFGPTGTYYDHLKEISGSGINLSKLANLEISDEEINEILLEAGFKGYRLEGSNRWIRNALSSLKRL